jgi:hypothetical protein
MLLIFATMDECAMKQLKYIVFIYLLGSVSLVHASNESPYQPRPWPQALNRCFTNFTSRFKDPGRLKVAIALGYSENIAAGFDLVRDGLVFDHLGQQFTAPCQYPGQGFCDFKLEKEIPHEPRHYFREILGPSQEPIILDVFVMNSSFEVSNAENETKYKNQQYAKSKRAQQFYSWALENADVVFYEGHSRDGGGPDFFPPAMNDHGKVNYSWYRKNQPGLRLMMNSLQRVQPIPPFLIGLFSCDSDSHFVEKLSPLVAQSSLILSTKIIEARSAKDGLFSALESVLNFECFPELSSRVQPYDFIVREFK